MLLLLLMLRDQVSGERERGSFMWVFSQLASTLMWHLDSDMASLGIYCYYTYFVSLSLLLSVMLVWISRLGHYIILTAFF
jgi:hypothetical protein